MLEIEDFETAFPVPVEKRGEVMRRFSTLLIDAESGSRYGSTGYVSRAFNAFGEEFAVKRLRGIGDGTPTALALDVAASFDSNEVKMLRNEFESQLAVSDIRGFPRLYGYGFAQGEPLILMEWIEGVSLDELMGSDIGIDVALRIGAELFAVLARLDSVRTRPVHRDISPKNVMVRTQDAPLADQLSTGAMDVRLIDFGSTTVRDERDPRFTESTSIMRRGTPEYAPPEMLTDALPNIIELRRSPAIDIYAACSVMYELLTGHTPFRLAERTGESTPYVIKTTEQPLPLMLDGHEDIAGLIMAGLSSDQAARPDASSLHVAFARACGGDLALEGARAPEQKTASGSVFSLPVEDGRHRSVRIASFNVRGEAQPREKLLARRGFVALAAAGIALLGTAGAGVLLTREREDVEEDEAEAAPTTVSYTGGSLYVAQDAETMLWGYLNAQRVWVIPPRFLESPGLFVEGRACARDPENGLYGYIEETGEWAIAPQFVQAAMFGEGLAACQTGGRWREGADNDGIRSGWIDRNGDWAIPPTFIGCGVFKNGLAAAKTGLDRDAKWGYIDTAGNTVIEEAFTDAGTFSDDGLARVAARPTRFGWIDRVGNWVIEPKYSMATSFNEGLAGFMETFSELWGYLDTAGNEIIDVAFSGARRFSAGVAAVQDDETGLWGFIDKTGAWKIAPQFARAGDFAHGLAPAQDIETSLFGYVDDTGHWVIDPRYASVNLNLME